MRIIITLPHSFQIITHVINHLAEKPELLIPLREEIKANIVADGWTSTGMGHMWKLDSILRETLRYHGVSPRTCVISRFTRCTLLTVLRGMP